MLGLSARLSSRVQTGLNTSSSVSGTLSSGAGTQEHQSLVRYFHRQIPNLDARSRASGAGSKSSSESNYAKAPWIDNMAIQKGRKSREFTAEETAAFLARKESRESQMRT